MKEMDEQVRDVDHSIEINQVPKNEGWEDLEFSLHQVSQILAGENLIMRGIEDSFIRKYESLISNGQVDEYTVSRLRSHVEAIRRVREQTYEIIEKFVIHE